MPYTIYCMLYTPSDTLCTVCVWICACGPINLSLEKRQVRRLQCVRCPESTVHCPLSTVRCPVDAAVAVVVLAEVHGATGERWVERVVEKKYNFAAH